MARKRGKMALYEVMSNAHARSDAAKAVEPLQPKKKPEKARKIEKVQVPAAREPVEPEPQVAATWRKRPRIVQYNLGRVEFSIPYQLAITVGLGLLLLFLLAFRFGQYSGRTALTPTAEPVGGSNAGPGRASLPGLANPETTRTVPPDNTVRPPVNRGTAPGAAPAAGSNVIVLAEYKAPTQLLPVQEYFGRYDIPTEIVAVGDTYFLQTKERFRDNPANPGTTGNELIKRIAELGKGYKAPQGYETFAAHLFDDAYGRKVEN